MANFNSARHPYSCFPFPTSLTVSMFFFFFLICVRIKSNGEKRKGKGSMQFQRRLKNTFLDIFQHLSAGDLVIVVTTIEYVILVIKRRDIQKEIF